MNIGAILYDFCSALVREGLSPPKKIVLDKKDWGTFCNDLDYTRAGTLAEMKSLTFKTSWASVIISQDMEEK